MVDAVEFSEIIRNWVLIVGAVGAGGIAVWRGVVADRASRAAAKQAQAALDNASAARRQEVAANFRGYCEDLWSSENQTLRLAAVFGLERLARADEVYADQIMIVLETHVRRFAPKGLNDIEHDVDLPDTLPDVLEASKVVTRFYFGDLANA